MSFPEIQVLLEFGRDFLDRCYWFEGLLIGWKTINRHKERGRPKVRGRCER
jgi:hypothetical protein